MASSLLLALSIPRSLNPPISSPNCASSAQHRRDLSVVSFRRSDWNHSTSCSSGGDLGFKGEVSLCRKAADFGEFSGLKRKMSSSEALHKRVRDPQLAAGEAKDTVTRTRNYVSAQISKPGVKSLVLFVGIPLILGSVDAVFNSPTSKWFLDLKKPWWEPPGPIFGGAWSVLYPLMGLASWLVWAEGGFHKQSLPLALYVTQLLLNLAWPLFFFGWKKLGLALVDILLLDVVLAATITAFQSVNQVAANLLKPYLAWVLFATALNFNLWLNNRADTPKTA